MKSPLEAYKEEKAKGKRRTETFNYFFQKYAVKPFEDTGFLETTERFHARKFDFFLPGRIYTWMYDPISKKELDYYDKRPLVLVHGQYVSEKGNVIVQGLNLNLLPEFTRVEVLENFFQVFKNDIYAAEKAIDKDQIGAVNRLWQYLTNWYFVYTLFNEKATIGYQWAVRNYIVGNIKSAVLIELEDWEKIPYYVSKDIAGKGLAAIWSDYIDKKKGLTEHNISADKATKIQKKYTKPGG